MKKWIISIAVVLCLSLALIFARQASAPSETASPSKKIPPINTSQSFNKQAHPIDQPDSIWWIVSKVRPLSPLGYAPTDLVTPAIPLRPGANSSEMRLRKEPADALSTMATDAKKVNIDLMLASGYRSYQLQVSVYNGYVQQYGQAGADQQSARPGTSEHQTGLSADLEPISQQCEVEKCFADLPEGIWLKDNAYKYGFIIRYQEGKKAIVGYEYEPWHIRYIGTDLSLEMHRQNTTTLEEFFGVVPDKQPY